MLTRTKIALALGAALTIASSQAATVKGTVTDEKGRPVANVEVIAEGTGQVAVTDEQGRYQLDDLDPEHVHLHVYSRNHVHGDKELDNIPEQVTTDFVLQSTTIENVVVRANGLRRSVLETITPVSVISAEQLRKEQAPTLGETLKNVPGVHSSYFGPVASSPIIRGTDGPRVKIVQNGLDVSDVSRVGPDHNVASEASSATQVEVLRGPLTLLYGSGAIGGVVNVVDNRIPDYVPEELEGEAELRYESAGDERFAKVDVTGGTGNVAFHLDAFDRDTDDYEIPGFAEVEPDEGEESGTLEGTAIDTQGVTAGLSYVGEKGYFGASVQRLENLYGVPGHGHDHGHGEEEEEHEGEEEGEEESVNLDVEMDRYQVAGELFSPTEWLNSIKLSAAYTDYEHTELEGEEIGTVFKNETSEARLSFTHKDIAGWHGVLGMHYSTTDYEAIGEEAFSPPTETDSFAVFLVEEKQVGDVTYQLGARWENTELSAEPVTIGELGAHGHEEEEHEEEHEGEEHHDEDEHHDEETEFAFNDLEYKSLSLSAGAIWNYTDGYSLAFSLSRSERAPSHQELFSAGEHIATQTFELGRVFTIDEDGEVMFNPDNPAEEVSTNLDVTWRKFSGDWGFTVSVFYNQVDDYIYQLDTGLFLEEEEEHGHEEEEHEGEEHSDEEHSEEGEVPILAFQQDDADLYGFEAEVHYQINDIWHLQVFADYIRAEVDNDDLPRIPPLRIGSELSFEMQNWYGDVGLTWYDDQTKVSEFETETDGYHLLDVSLNYRYESQHVDWIFFAKGTNLTDEEARVHTSYLKDQAPLPGRGFSLGVRAQF